MAGVEKITMTTAYDAPTISIIEEVGIDIVLVGDSVGKVVLGYEDTLPVTIDEMLHHTKAVNRASESTLIVTDIPFLSYGIDESDTIRNAGRLIKEGGADAVKIESSPQHIRTINRLVDLGIPVMAHLGFTPQHIKQLGGYKQSSSTEKAAEQLITTAQDHESAGVFSIVLEHVPSRIAEQVTEQVNIPTIGIASGPHTDGQVLVINDITGLSTDVPPFAKQFSNVHENIIDALSSYKTEVKRGEFPAQEHSNIEELDNLY